MIRDTISKSFLIFCCISGIAYANSYYEPIENLKKITTDYITSNIALAPDETLKVDINTSDVPSQLVSCSRPIVPNFPAESSREKINAIELTCQGEPSWHVFVPVNAQVFAKVVVAKHLIGSGDVIGEDDLDFTQANTNRLYNGYTKDPHEIIGNVASQMITAGTVLNKRNVKRPVLIHKNQAIDLVARKNAVEVSMKAVAKSEGGLNDAITAYNPSSKRTVDAIVVGSNRAEVMGSS